VKQKEVTELIGTGYIGMAIIRRVSAGRHVILFDHSEEKALKAAKHSEIARD